MTLEIPLALRNRETADAAPPSLAHARSHPPNPISNFSFHRPVSVVSVVANASLADAVGRVARGGGARHENLPAARTFPHTAYPRATWARELCGAIRRRWCGGDADVILVVEEGFIAPMWAEWHASYGDERLPPVIAVVGKKTHLRDDAAAVGTRGDERRIDPARIRARRVGTRATRLRKPPRAHRLRRNFGMGGSDRDSDSPASASTAPRPPAPHDRDEDPAGMEAGWRALLRSITQVVRPVKPSAMRAAMRRAEAMLERADGGGGKDVARGTGAREPAFGPARIPAGIAAETMRATTRVMRGGANGAGSVSARPGRASRARP